MSSCGRLVRAAIDVGSGTTKMVIAEVDVNNMSDIKMLESVQVHLGTVNGRLCTSRLPLTSDQCFHRSRFPLKMIWIR